MGLAMKRQKQFWLIGMALLLLVLAVGLRPASQVANGAAGRFKNLGAGNLELVGHYGGYTTAVAVQGNYAFVRRGMAFVVIDISVPTAPVQLSYLVLPEGVFDIAVAGDYAYVASGNGLRVIDVSDPTIPAEVGFYATPDTVLALAVDGNTVYLAADSAGLRVIDVSNPTQPAEVDFYDSTGSVGKVQVEGQYAYILEDSSPLRIFDISDPSNLVEAGSYNLPWSEVQDFTVAGQLVYFVYTYFYPYSLIQIVGVSDPLNPVELGSYQFPYDGYNAKNIRVAGNYAYVLMNGCSTVGCSAGLFSVLDISNPAEPAEVAYASSPLGNDLRDLVIHGTYAYVAGSWKGLQVIKIDPPAAPEPIASFGGYLAADFLEVAPNHHAYVAMNQYVAQYSTAAGVQVLNLADPTKLQPGTFIETGFGYVDDLELEGNYAYLVGNNRHDGNLIVIDVSDPAEPGFVASWFPALPFPPGHMFGVAVNGHYAYVSTGPIHKLDISDPTQPAAVERYSAPDPIDDLVIQGNFAYAFGRWGGLSLLSLDPLQHITSFNMGGRDLYFAGHYAYLVLGNRLSILDVTNPAEPVEVGFYDTPGNAQHILVIGEYAYLADRLGLRVLDVSDPTIPVEIGFYYTGGATQDVAFDGKYIYALDAYSGVYAYKLLGLDQQFYLPLISQVE